MRVPSARGYQGYRTGYDIAGTYRDEIVRSASGSPTKTCWRYNGMLIGVFDLLADARAQIASVNSYIESLPRLLDRPERLAHGARRKAFLTAAPRAAPCGCAGSPRPLIRKDTDHDYASGFLQSMGLAGGAVRRASVSSVPWRTCPNS